MTSSHRSQAALAATANGTPPSRQAEVAKGRTVGAGGAQGGPAAPTDQMGSWNTAGRLLLAWLVTVVALTVGVAPSPAAIIGSNLSASPNGSVCAFSSLEPETRSCTVSQWELADAEVAGDGLTVPFDGVVTQWSVVSGNALPGTGSVKLALRAFPKYGDTNKGPEGDLPLSPLGARHSFPESMKVYAGQRLGLKISVSNGSPQEAGAPLAFKQPFIGVTDTWIYGDAEPMSGTAINDTEENTELLFAAVIEPDADGDGLGDLSQDCFPNHRFDQELCGHDLQPPEIDGRVRRRQSLPFTFVVEEGGR